MEIILIFPRSLTLTSGHAEMLSNFTSLLVSKFNLVTVPLLGRELDEVDVHFFWRRVYINEEAPIYFSNIFIYFLGLAYFTPLGCPLRFKFFWAV